MELNNKKILLIIPKFFGYEKRIQHNLEERGASVSVVYENIGELGIIKRFIYVYGKKIKEQYVFKYYKSKIKQNGYDIVFVIRGSSVSKKVIEMLKFNNPQAEFVIYQWDSVKNNKNAIEIADDFDKRYTFDKKDAIEYNWTFRPLFFCEESDERKSYDISFICSLHSKRAEIYGKLKRIAAKNNIKAFLYLYAKRVPFLKHKYLQKDPVYKEISINQIKFKSLCMEDMNRICSKSKIIVDYAHPGQNGLTMRTLESVGHKCKLITNNKNIYATDIYNENNVYVYNDEDDFEIINDLLETPYEKLNDEIYEKYSLDGWIESILGDKQYEYEQN